MKRIATIRLIAAATLCAFAAGCTVCQNVRRTMHLEPKSFSWKQDRKRSLELYLEWAQQAWREERGYGVNAPEYRDGFLDGFTEFVYAGGTGEPPPLPPRRFWNADWRLPQGQLKAEEWFAGYRHGASVARDGGFREQVTVNTSFAYQVQGDPQLGYPSSAPGQFEMEEQSQIMEELPGNWDGATNARESASSDRPTPVHGLPSDDVDGVRPAAWNVASESKSALPAPGELHRPMPAKTATPPIAVKPPDKNQTTLRMIKDASAENRPPRVAAKPGGAAMDLPSQRLKTAEKAVQRPLGIQASEFVR